MEERLADLRQRLDKTRDLRRAELLKGASQGRELVEGYDKEVADYLSEIMSLQVIVGENQEATFVHLPYTSEVETAPASLVRCFLIFL